MLTVAASILFTFLLSHTAFADNSTTKYGQNSNPNASQNALLGIDACQKDNEGDSPFTTISLGQLSSDPNFGKALANSAPGCINDSVPPPPGVSTKQSKLCLNPPPQWQPAGGEKSPEEAKCMSCPQVKPGDQPSPADAMCSVVSYADKSGAAKWLPVCNRKLGLNSDGDVNPNAFSIDNTPGSSIGQCLNISQGYEQLQDKKGHDSYVCCAGIPSGPNVNPPPGSDSSCIVCPDGKTKSQGFCSVTPLYSDMALGAQQNMSVYYNCPGAKGDASNADSANYGCAALLSNPKYTPSAQDKLSQYQLPKESHCPGIITGSADHSLIAVCCPKDALKGP